MSARGFGDRWIRWIKCILFSSKSSFLVNGSPKGYVWHLCGLRQGDPLSPLLFVLVTDVLYTMFSHALHSKILVGLLLRWFRSRCNLHYTDNLLVITTGGLEDLRIVKLILLVFEGISGLATNFAKTCLYSSSLRKLLEPEEAGTLNCERGLLPIMYLGIPIYGRKPKKQEWEGLISKIRKRLSSWKVKHLSFWRLAHFDQLCYLCDSNLLYVFV